MSEVIKTKQLIKDIDEIIQRVKEIPPSRETSLSITKLQESVIYLGMNLKRLNELYLLPKFKRPIK